MFSKTCNAIALAFWIAIIFGGFIMLFMYSIIHFGWYTIAFVIIAIAVANSLISDFNK